MSGAAILEEVMSTEAVGVQLVTIIVRALVDDEEKIAIETTPLGDGTVIRVHVCQDDIGKLIGKQGRTARSIRAILGAASIKLHHRFMLDIVEGA